MMAFLEHLLHVRALHGPKDGVRINAFFLVHEEVAEVRRLGPVGQVGGFGLPSARVGGRGGGVGLLIFAVRGDVFEVDIFAVLVLRRGFVGRLSDFGLVRGFMKVLLLVMLLLLLLLGWWLLMGRRIRRIGKRDLVVCKLLYVRMIPGSQNLLGMVVLLIGLILGG